MEIRFDYDEIREAKALLGLECFGGNAYNAFANVMEMLRRNAKDRTALAIVHVLQKGHVDDFGYLSLPKTCNAINSTFDTDNMSAIIWTDEYSNETGTDYYYVVVDLLRYNGTVEYRLYSNWQKDSGEWVEEDMSLGFENNSYVTERLNEAIAALIK